jgi:hypothetical protein
VQNYTDQLLQQFEATNGMPINATDWFNFYSFDIMGDLAFGRYVFSAISHFMLISASLRVSQLMRHCFDFRSFDMLKHGVEHYFLKALRADLAIIGVLSHMPWLLQFLKITPILNAEHLKFWEWVENQVKIRRQVSLDNWMSYAL